MRKLVLLLAVVACLGVSAVNAGSAEAWAHRWNCTVGSAQVCWDVSGQFYNPWISVVVWSGGTVSELCAKAVTQANNLRTGSGCSYTTSSRVSCIASATPDSQAYVYWGGSGGPHGLQGDARTADDNIFC
jgi:hypothetical protein